MYKYLLISLVAISISFDLDANQTPNKPHISVQGLAETKVYPDLIKINLQIKKEANELIHSMEYINRKTQKLLDILKIENVKSSDIDYSNTNSYESFKYDQISQKNIHVGVIVERNIIVTIRQIENYNRLIKLLLDAEINSINHVELKSSLESQITQELSSEAIQQAFTKAKLLANNLDVHLRGIYTAYEDKNSYGNRPANEPPISFNRESINQKLSTLDFSPGKITISANYTVIFLIEGK